MRSQPVQELIQTSLLSTPALPEELWLDIFCLPDLSYFDLRRLSRCSKTHRTLLHTRPALSNRLFKGVPREDESTSAADLDKVLRIHPLIWLVECTPNTPFKDLVLDHPTNPRRLSSLTSMHEKATSPPLKEITVVIPVGMSPGPRNRLRIISPQGV